MTARKKLFIEAFGKLVDVEGVDRLKQGVRAHIIETAPVDALATLARERLLERFPSQTDDQFRTYLLAAFTLWRKAGTEAGVLAALNAAYPGPTYAIIENHDWEPEPPDGDTDYWSRFWVTIGEPVPWEVWTIGSGEIIGEPELTIGSTATLSEVNLFRRLIKIWKPAHAVLVAILVTIDFLDGEITIEWPGV